MNLRRALARLITRAAQIFTPLCPGGCRQPLDSPCRCDPWWDYL